MVKIIQCPICNNQAKWEYYSSPWGLEEEQIDCSHCGYYYQFAYGNYMECVKGEEFVWNYTIHYPTQFLKELKEQCLWLGAIGRSLRKHIGR